jgi:hypothetical protein
MKTTGFTAHLAFALALGSCGSQGNREEMYSLVKSETAMSFPLDDRTKNFILALFPYTGADGTEYLSFQNQGRNELLFYNMNTQQPAFKINPEAEGDQGVGQTIGYYIHNPDSIFLTSSGTERISLIDREARVKDRFRFSQTDDGLPLLSYISISATYHPIVFLDNKLYICPKCNRRAEKNPVCATIDVSSHAVQALSGFPYPTYPGGDNQAKTYGAEVQFSRCYDGERFVYSFYFEEDISVVSLDHTSVERVKIKSRYIDKVVWPDDYTYTMEQSCTDPHYGNLLHDPYRDVYYRIAYPQTELEKGVRAMELL